MSDAPESLVFDLVEWVAKEPRPYAEMLDAWRTSCPRLPVWEEANARGFLEQRHPPGGKAVVVVSEAGMRRLEERAMMRGDARAATRTAGASPLAESGATPDASASASSAGAAR